MKNVNFKFGRAVAAVLCAAAFLVGGCEDAVNSGKSKGTGSVTLNLSVEGVPQTGSKSTGALFTVYPGGAGEFKDFTVSFTPTVDGAAHDPVTIADISQSVTIEDLVVGTYTVKVTAARADDTDSPPAVVAVGEVPDIEVNADPGLGETVNIILGPSTEDGLSDGVFAYDVSGLEGATSVTLTISDKGGTQVGEAIDLKTAANGTVSLAPGYYYADVVADSASGGGEVIHIYSGMTSTWDVEFTIGTPGLSDPNPVVNGMTMTVGFGHEVIPVTVSPEGAAVTKGGNITFTATDTEYTNVKWYTDGNVSAKTTAAGYTVAKPSAKRLPY